MHKLMRYIKGYERQALLAPLFKMLEACFELFVPLVIASIIDTGIKNQDAAFIWTRCGLLVLLAAIGLASSLTAQWFSATAALGFGTALRKDLFRHIDTLSYSELDGIGTPTLVTRMTSDINQVQNGVNLTLRLLLRSPFIVIGALIMAFSISPKLTLLFIGVTIMVSLIIWAIMRVTVPIYHEAQNGLDRVTLLTRENYVGARVVRAFARQADELAAFVWDRRHEFHYTGTTAQPDEALRMALDCPGKPVFLTDSGDNTTSGSVGANTWVLRQVMALSGTKGKNFLFGCITDPAVVAQLADVPEGTQTHIRLGMDLDELSRPVELDVTVKHKGRLEGFLGYQGDYGACVLVSVEGYPIDIIVAEVSHAVVELHQFEAAGAHCADYGVVIVKQGYIFPELKTLGALSVMSLTNGATLQDTRRLPFKRIMRPMFPVDDI